MTLDDLAQIVGHVILRFGAIDQRIYFAIRNMGMAKSWPFDEPIDRRFTHRLEHFRRLCRELSREDKAFLSEVDRRLNEIRRLEIVRSHLAHGMLAYDGEERNIRVADMREINDMHATMLKERPLTKERRNQLAMRHVNITYTPSYLTEVADELKMLAMNLGRLESQAVQLWRGQESPPVRED